MEMTNKHKLLAHHTELDAQLDRLVHQARGGDWDAIRDAFTLLSTELLQHMTGEEQHLLPELARSHPDEARAIAAEHVELRKLLDHVGLGIDLHLFRFDTAENLAARLRDHARREDALLYPWAAERALSP